MPIDVISSPATIGKVRRPEAVADTPLTYWRCVGRNVIAPSMAKPTTNASTMTTLNTGSRNSRMGRIGSRARRSINTKPASAATEMAYMPMIVGELHA